MLSSCVTSMCQYMEINVETSDKFIFKKEEEKQRSSKFTSARSWLRWRSCDVLVSFLSNIVAADFISHECVQAMVDSKFKIFHIHDLHVGLYVIEFKRDKFHGISAVGEIVNIKKCKIFIKANGHEWQKCGPDGTLKFQYYPCDMHPEIYPVDISVRGRENNISKTLSDNLCDCHFKCSLMMIISKFKIRNGIYHVCWPFEREIWLQPKIPHCIHSNLYIYYRHNTIKISQNSNCWFCLQISRAMSLH